MVFPKPTTSPIIAPPFFSSRRAINFTAFA